METGCGLARPGVRGCPPRKEDLGVGVSTTQRRLGKEEGGTTEARRHRGEKGGNQEFTAEDAEEGAEVRRGENGREGSPPRLKGTKVHEGGGWI